MSNPYESKSLGDSSSAQAPIIRPVSWPVALFHIVILLSLLVGCFIWFGTSESIVLASGAWLAYSFGSRWILTRAHRRGMKLNRAGRHEEAVSAFQASYQFFSRYSWIDRFRAITMLSAAAMSYREMALCNMAFAYSQMGMGLQAKQTYQRALAEFPESGLATAALRFIDAGERIHAPVNAAS